MEKRLLFFLTIWQLLLCANTAIGQHREPLGILLKKQQVKPIARFLQDSVRVGEECALALSIRYPEGFDVVFPDSLAVFAPFEVSRKQFFPTRKEDKFFVDSAIFWVKTFEIEPIQKAAAWVWVGYKGDSLRVYTDSASIYFKEVLKEAPQLEKLKANADFFPFTYETNYPLWVLVFSLLIILSLVLLWWMLPRLRRRWALLALQKRHKQFTEAYQKQESAKPNEANQKLGLWKKHMSYLSGHPYDSLTTKELAELKVLDENQLKHLQGLDRFVYGGIAYIHEKEAFTFFLELAEQSFEQKKQELAKKKQRVWKS